MWVLPVPDGQARCSFGASQPFVARQFENQRLINQRLALKLNVSGLLDYGFCAGVHAAAITRTESNLISQNPANPWTHVRFLISWP